MTDPSSSTPDDAAGWTVPGAPPPTAPPPPGAPTWGQPQPSGQWGQPQPPGQWGQPQPAQWGQQPAQWGQWGQPPGGPWGAVPMMRVDTAPRPGVIPLRPLAVGEILDGALKIIRAAPGATLGLSAVFALVGGAFALVANVLLGLDFEGTPGASRTDELLGGLSAVMQGLTTIVGTLVMAGVVTSVAGRAVLGEPMSLGECWREVRGRVPALLGLALVQVLAAAGVITVLGGAAVALFTFLGAPGVVLAVLLSMAATAAIAYLYVLWSLAAPALVLERCGIRTSLRRSGVLVRGSWWRTAGVLLLAAMVTGVVGLVLQLPFLFFGAVASAVAGDAESVLLVVAVTAGSTIATALTSPFDAGTRSLLYVDRRMRAEGLDVALAARAAAGADPGPGAGAA